jgi:hypothetical protein
MPDTVKVLTADPPTPPNVTPTTTLQPSEVNTIQNLFIPKADFTEGANHEICYVLDGGDATPQPCNAA